MEFRLVEADPRFALSAADLACEDWCVVEFVMRLLLTSFSLHSFFLCQVLEFILDKSQTFETSVLQADLSAALTSQLFWSIPHTSMSRLHASMKRRCGRPFSRLPVESSPYMRSLGMRPSSIRLCTWPSQRSRP